MNIMLVAAAALVLAAQAQPPAPATDAPAAAAEPAARPEDDARKEAKEKDAEARALVAEFRKGLKDRKTESDLSSAIGTLGGMQHPVILQELTRWLGHANAVVCGAAAEQMARYKDNKNAAEALLTAARNRKDKASILKCLAAAGEVGYRASATGLLQFVNHQEVEVCRAAVESCGKLKSKYTIDRLIALVEELEKMPTSVDNVEVVAAPGGRVFASGPTLQQINNVNRRKILLPLTHTVLTQVTGQQCYTGQDWSLWWSRSKADFKELE